MEYKYYVQLKTFPITGYRIHKDLIKAFAVGKKAADLANLDVKRLYVG
jgi:aspartate ammonia-lyase